MAQNIEIKARLTDDQFQKLVTRVSSLVDQSALLIQTDTFFHAPNCRLKLREFREGGAELIAYHRADQTGPKVSDYILSPIEHAVLLKESLSRSIGIRGVVKKQRRLFLIGQTRVHLDEVEDLGKFVELEVVLREDQTHQEGNAVAQQLIAELDIGREQLIDGAYIDLLESCETAGSL